MEFNPAHLPQDSQSSNSANALLKAAEDSLTSVCELLEHDPGLVLPQKVLRGAIIVLRAQEDDGANPDVVGEQFVKMIIANRRIAHERIEAAINAITQAARKSSPKARKKLEKLCEVLSEQSNTCAAQARAADVRANLNITEAERKLLRSLAGTLLGFGHKQSKLDGLVKARAARARKRREAAEKLRQSQTPRDAAGASSPD